MKKQINVSVDSKDYEKFMRLYKGCLTRLIQKVIHAVVNDKELFLKLFFGD